MLDILAGRKRKSGLSGIVLVNGDRQPKNFKCISGYVVQVRKTLMRVWGGSSMFKLEQVERASPLIFGASLSELHTSVHMRVCMLTCLFPCLLGPTTYRKFQMNVFKYFTKVECCICLHVPAKRVQE